MNKYPNAFKSCNYCCGFCKREKRSPDPLEAEFGFKVKSKKHGFEINMSSSSDEEEQQLNLDTAANEEEKEENNEENNEENKEESKEKSKKVQDDLINTIEFEVDKINFATPLDKGKVCSRRKYGQFTEQEVSLIHHGEVEELGQ